MNQIKFGAKLVAIAASISILAACNGGQPAVMQEAVKAKKKETKAITTGNYELLNKASWILGSWKGEIGKGVSVEVWTKRDDSTFSGGGLFIKGKVTVSQETITLSQRGQELLYIPTVKDQNGGEPVIFKMTKLSENEMIFENPGHDFPQKISYKRSSPDAVVATISGNTKDGPRSESFPMNRDVSTESK